MAKVQKVANRFVNKFLTIAEALYNVYTSLCAPKIMIVDPASEPWVPLGYLLQTSIGIKSIYPYVRMKITSKLQSKLRVEFFNSVVVEAVDR